MFLNQCNVLIAKDWVIQATAAEQNQDALCAEKNTEKIFDMQHPGAVLIVVEHIEQTQEHVL